MSATHGAAAPDQAILLPAFLVVLQRIASKEGRQIHASLEGLLISHLRLLASPIAGVELDSPQTCESAISIKTDVIDDLYKSQLILSYKHIETNKLLDTKW